MARFKVGVQLHPQATTVEELRAAFQGLAAEFLADFVDGVIEGLIFVFGRREQVELCRIRNFMDQFSRSHTDKPNLAVEREMVE